VIVTDDIREVTRAVLNSYTGARPELIINFTNSMTAEYRYCKHCKEYQYLLHGSILSPNIIVPPGEPTDIGGYLFCTVCGHFYPTSDRDSIP